MGAVQFALDVDGLEVGRGVDEGAGGWRGNVELEAVGGDRLQQVPEGRDVRAA